MSSIRTRQTKPHSVDCIAMKAVKRKQWATPWYFPNGLRNVAGVVRRDKLGRRTKGCGGQWLVLRCNTCDSDPCEAEMLVSLEDVYALVPHGKRKTKRRIK